MLQEEIARLTGKLVFQVDNRPLATFEKKLGGVLSMLKELSTLANKKFTVKVALDGRSLRAQIDKATKTKITLSNVDISNEALHLQGKRIQDYLNKTTINLNNVKVDIGKLIEQKRFIKTLLGQMQLELPVKLGLNKMEQELRRDLKGVSERNPLKISVQLANNNLAMKLRKAMIEAQKKMGELKIRVADPQVRLKVDKQHLIEEIKAAIASHDFNIRVGARRGDLGGGGGRRGEGGGGRSQAERGLSAAAGFARGALPGLGAAFAVNQLNQINQQMQAQQNAMTAVMGSEQAGKEQSAWVRNLSNTIGMDYRAVAPSYNKMLASGKTSGMSTESVQNIFQGVSEYGRTMGLDSEAMKGSMRAIEQMMNKGQVMSEELKGQLAERMPGAMSAMAEAAGFGDGPDAVAKLFKAMENGEVKSAAVLEKFSKILAERARDGDALAKAMESTAAQQARMNNAFSDSVAVFAAGGFDKGMAAFFKEMADAMTRSEPLIKALGGAFEILMKPINALIRLIGDLGEAWPKFAEALGVSEKALAALAVGIGIFLLPFGGFITAIGLAALAIEDLVTYFKGGESVFGNWIKNTEGAQESMDGLEESLTTLKNTWTELKASFEGVTNPFKDWSLDATLLSALDSVKALLDSITSVMRATIQIKEGNYADAGKTLFEGAKTAYEGFPLTKMYKAGSAAAGGAVDSGLGMLLNPNGSMKNSLPETYSGKIDRTGGGSTPLQPITIAPGAIPLQLTVQAPEGTDPHVFGNKLGVHVQTLLNEGIMNMLGAARAQQAEGQ
ncbi:hypothetical protein PJKIFABJ_00099 [Pseudomonas phage PE09]|uniref:Tape measure protein N-terminal domain-containing protein n=2 Tax=Otagovirus TaxID=2560197 RepID=A0A7S8BD71_9CAUD|nr:hypothetical protein QGX22_gp155 [Pseudomonas phage PE09]YP_010768386.1 hypothetical protein QGX23_gp153 [Pseudomonas phage PN09]QHZ60035.1 hypothetical protein PJKIFABJ_00099 [Pseudomonas phage PE09]QPB10499.1 hypothetical protein PN09_078 [Pseudomonas phage PN09]